MKRILSIQARPAPFVFTLSECAVVVIDMQRDFLEPGGFGEALGNDVSQLRGAIAPVQTLLEAAREFQMYIIHTRESHLPDLSDCPPVKLEQGKQGYRIGDVGPMGRILVRGEPGNAIIDAVAPLPGEMQIDKPGKGMFYGTGLHEKLKEKGIRSLIFAGVTTEVCVQTSMREANDRGYACLLIEEATESYFPEFKQSTMNMIAAQGGIVGKVAKLNAFLQSLKEMVSDE